MPEKSCKTLRGSKLQSGKDTSAFESSSLKALASNEQKKCETAYHALTADRLRLKALKNIEQRQYELVLQDLERPVKAYLKPAPQKPKSGFLKRVRAQTSQSLLMEELRDILQPSPRDEKERLDEQPVRNTEDLQLAGNISWADLSALPVSGPEEPSSSTRRSEASDGSNAPTEGSDRLAESPVSFLSSRASSGLALDRTDDLQTSKDFDVGQLYTQKVVLTNTGRSVNQLRFVGCSKEIENFIHVRANPSGPLSPGMTYTVEVSLFTPINQDISGEVNFLSPFGIKTVPVVCSMKRFRPYLEPATMVFADSVVRETQEREVTLGNLGALECAYEIRAVDAATETATAEDTGDTPPNTTDAVDNGAETPQEIKIGDMTLTGPIRGRLGAKSAVRVALRWQPTNARDVGYDEARFQIVFADSELEPLTLVVRGRARDAAIWLEETSVNFGLCWFDRLYQKSLHLHNRSTHAVRVNASVANEAICCVEVLPKSVIVQAGDTSKVQLKLLPHASLKSLNQLRREGDDEDGEKAVIFDAQSGSLRTTLCFEVPEEKSQDLKVGLTATITTSELLFDPPLLDFGRIPISQTGVVHFRLINPGLIPLKFGFTEVPQAFSVQPNDGFGTLLPKESFEMRAFFSPTEAADCSCNLTCRNEIGGFFQLPCKAVALKSPISLSTYSLRFPPTLLHDYSRMELQLRNEEPSKRKGDANRLGQTVTFQFEEPEDAQEITSASLTFSPPCGILKPGETMKVTVTYIPEDFNLTDEEATPEKSKEQVKNSPLDPFGPFTVLSQINAIQPHSFTKIRILCEAGAESRTYLESLDFTMRVEQSPALDAAPFFDNAWSGTLRLPVHVNCVVPRIRIIEDDNEQTPRSQSATAYLVSSSEDGADPRVYTVNMGAVVVGDAVDRRLVFVNDSAVDVPICILSEDVETASLVFTPSRCTLPSNSRTVITVTFRPDFVADFWQGEYVCIFNNKKFFIPTLAIKNQQQRSVKFVLRGSAEPQLCYVRPDDGAEMVPALPGMTAPTFDGLSLQGRKDDSSTIITCYF
ncbi:hypothetical protein SprV_0902738300 [Sparganum proliferum]